MRAAPRRQSNKVCINAHRHPQAHTFYTNNGTVTSIATLVVLSLGLAGTGRERKKERGGGEQKAVTEAGVNLGQLLVRGSE